MMRTVRSIRRASLSVGLVLGFAGLLAGCGSGSQAQQPSPEVMANIEAMRNNMPQEKAQYYAQKRSMMKSMKSAKRGTRKTEPK